MIGYVQYCCILTRIISLIFFRMVNLRPRNHSTESETPELRGMIALEVGETLHQLLPGLFAQIKNEIDEMIDQKIEAEFVAGNPGAGAQVRDRTGVATTKISQRVSRHCLRVRKIR